MSLCAFTSYTASSNVGAASITTDSNLTVFNYASSAASFLAAGGGLGEPGNYFSTGSGNPTSDVGTQASFVLATEALAVSNGTYHTLTLTPAAKAALSFNTAGGVNTLTFDLRVHNPTAGSTVIPYPANLALCSSVDNFVGGLGNRDGYGRRGEHQHRLRRPIFFSPPRWEPCRSARQ